MVAPTYTQLEEILVPMMMFYGEAMLTCHSVAMVKLTFWDQDKTKRRDKLGMVEFCHKKTRPEGQNNFNMTRPQEREWRGGEGRGGAHIL